MLGLGAQCGHEVFLSLLRTSPRPDMAFPEVQRGGSLILAWQIKGKNVLVIGGGEVCEPVSVIMLTGRSRLVVS